MWSDAGSVRPGDRSHAINRRRQIKQRDWKFTRSCDKDVDNHRARLMQKLGVHNAASLTLVAVQMGICPTFQGSRGPAVLEHGGLSPSGYDTIKDRRGNQAEADEQEQPPRRTMPDRDGVGRPLIAAEAASFRLISSFENHSGGWNTRPTSVPNRTGRCRLLPKIARPIFRTSDPKTGSASPVRSGRDAPANEST